MALTINVSNASDGYSEIKGHLLLHHCLLQFSKARFFKADDNTIVLAGVPQNLWGVDIFPKGKTMTDISLACIRLHKDVYTARAKDGDKWIDVPREPSRVESMFCKEILSNFDFYSQKTWEVKSLTFDSSVPESQTLSGTSNPQWNIEPTIGTVPDWVETTYKSSTGYKQYSKPDAKSIYLDAIAMFKAEIDADRENSLAGCLEALKAKYGESMSAEVANILLYGLLGK
jgi:hypothetical protein